FQWFDEADYQASRLGSGAASNRVSSSAIQAAAVNSTSVELLRAVSAESCNTPMMKPTATTCMAMSLPMPNRLHASGISSKEPPATPEAPQALMVATTESSTAVATISACGG